MFKTNYKKNKMKKINMWIRFYVPDNKYYLFISINEKKLNEASICIEIDKSDVKNLLKKNIEIKKDFKQGIL